MSDWRDWFQGRSPRGVIAHPDSPAGGSGPGFSRSSPGPGISFWSSARLPHPDSPAATSFNWQSVLPRIDFEERAEALYQAIRIAKRRAPQAIREATGQELNDLVAGVIPGLLAALAIVAVPTGALAFLGFVTGSLAGIVGSVPAAAAGAAFGFELGVWILEYLGLAFLATYLGASLVRAGALAEEASKLAWNSVDHPQVQQLEIQRAGEKFASAIALIVRGLLQGIVAFLLAKGTAAAASRVPELVEQLRNSKLGAGFADWVDRNWSGLIRSSELKDEVPSLRRGGGGGSGSGGAGSAEQNDNAGPSTSSKSDSKRPKKDPAEKKSSPTEESVASKLEDSVFNGVKADRVRPGADDKVAVIGRSMAKSVQPYADGLQKTGYNVETFSGAQISDAAQAQWKNLISKYAPNRIPDDVAQKSQMFQENKAWAEKLAAKGYTVVDVDNPTGEKASPFYEIEKQTLFGGGGAGSK